MTEKAIGLIQPVEQKGKRWPIPEADGFLQVAGEQFKISNLLWIKPTEDTNLQKLCEEKLKSVIETFTYKDEPLFENVLIGVTKPRGDSIAHIELDSPSSIFKIHNMRKNKITTATGFVGFSFSEELSDARDRRRQAPALFIDWILENPIFKVDI